LLATNHSQIDSLIEKLESEKGIKELEILLREEGLSRWAKPLLIVDQAMYRERVLEKAKAAKPDLILLYDKLPGSVDLELILEELRLEVRNSQERDTRIVFLTSLEQGSTLLRKAVEIGIWDIISGKEIRPLELIQRIYNPANYSEAARFKLAPDNRTKYQLIPQYIEKEKVVEVPLIKEKEVVRIVKEKELVRVGGTNASKEAVLVWSPYESGKTFLAVNLAVALSKMGLRVALMDTDPVNRSLESFFSLEKEERYVFIKALKERRKSPEILKNCPTYKKRLRLFTLPAGRAEMPEVSSEEFLSLFDIVRGDSDILIMDGARDINSTMTKVALSMASRVLLIVTPDLIRIKCLKAKLRELSTEGIRLNKFEPVINLAPAGTCPGCKEIKEVLELEPVGQVPPVLKEAYLSIYEGIPVMDGKPGDPSFIKAVNSLAQHLYGEQCFKDYPRPYSLLSKLLK
jgi:Mrp family chromosome partitioning ATPase/CheY-like chemotaxis protein